MSDQGVNFEITPGNLKIYTTSETDLQDACHIFVNARVIWLILVFGEALKTTDLSAMLLQQLFAGGGARCRPRPFSPYQKGWK